MIRKLLAIVAMVAILLLNAGCESPRLRPFPEDIIPIWHGLS